MRTDANILKLDLGCAEYARYEPIHRLRQEWDRSDARLHNSAAEDDPTYRHKVAEAIREMNLKAEEIAGRNYLESW